MVKVDCVAEAIKESYDKGAHESSVEMARKLLVRGKDSIEEIAELVNLPVEEVEEIKKEI